MNQTGEGAQARHSAAPRSWVVSRGCGAALAGLLLVGCASATVAGPPVRPLVPASARSRLTALAEAAVRVNGGHAPAWTSVVLTTRKKALTSATPGDFVPNDAATAVYLVTMKGRFTAYSASYPAGGSAPTGSYLSLVVDAHTFRTLDSGLAPKPPPVAPASLGPVTYLKVR
jgi:hypothetical protein